MDVQLRCRLGEVVIRLLKRPHHLDELLAAVFRQLLLIDEEGHLQFLAGDQCPEILEDIVVEENDFVRLPKVGLQPFAVPVGVIILRES